MCTLSGEQTNKLHQQIAEAQKVLNDWDQIITKQQAKINSYQGNCYNQNYYNNEAETCQQSNRCCNRGCSLDRLTKAVQNLQTTIQESKEKHRQELLNEINIYSNTIDQKLNAYKSN